MDIRIPRISVIIILLSLESQCAIQAPNVNQYANSQASHDAPRQVSVPVLLHDPFAAPCPYLRIVSVAEVGGAVLVRTSRSAAGGGNFVVPVPVCPVDGTSVETEGCG